MRPQENTETSPARQATTIPARVFMAIVLIAVFAWLETRTSFVQSHALSQVAKRAVAPLAPGKSRITLEAPGGPYDKRLGYDARTEQIEALESAGFEIAAQAAPTKLLRGLSTAGITPPYVEKNTAGLRIVDARGEQLYSATEPALYYHDFDEVPELLVRTLLFIENRELLGPVPGQNPAVEWPRLARATLEWGLSFFGGGGRVPGGSTLATQLEKLRHSPYGLTVNSKEKLRQMASASLRAYVEGPDTSDTRRRIVVDYLNSIKLAAVPGHGEVIGVPMALALWYGSDYQVVGSLIDSEATDDLSLKAKAYAYRQALGLVLAAGRPHLFLVSDPEALAARTERFLAMLAREGVISSRLAEAAQKARPEFHLRRVAPQSNSSAERAGARPTRIGLMELLDVGSLFEIDRLDLEARTSSIGIYEREVQRVLDEVRDKDSDTNKRLRRLGLLKNNDPSNLTLSFSLYERTGDVNRLRIHADTKRSSRLVDDSVMLDLGSTAKLRTLVTYLELMAQLYDTVPGPGTTIDKRDILGRWAQARRAARPTENVESFLEAAMLRRYSANPYEKFYTGRGFHRFANFNEDHDELRFSVRNATRYSVNLIFIRLMQDVVSHLVYGSTGERAELLTRPDHPLRPEYLERAAEFETTQLLRRYHRLYNAREPQAMRERYFREIRLTPRRAAVLLRFMHEDLPRESFANEMRDWIARTPKYELTEEDIAEMYDDYDPRKFSPADLRHLAGSDWLRLFTLRHLTEHPEASFYELLEAGRGERHNAFSWLAATRMKVAQDRRIYSEMEVDAFRWIHGHWKALGYPFARLVPSLATALGASADRPTALAELMGIIQADGVKNPVRRVEEIRLGAGTPYDTIAIPKQQAPERVMTKGVARVLQRTLFEVVEHGTARRAGGAIPGPDGKLLRIGGKTGTGDHVRKTVDADGAVVATSAVSRSAVFPFMIGDRYHGVITVYVKGADADKYEFTSSLATEILHSLRLVLISMAAETPEALESERARAAERRTARL